MKEWVVFGGHPFWWTSFLAEFLSFSLRHLQTPVEPQRRPGGAKLPSQSENNFLRRVLGLLQNVSTLTSGAVGWSHFFGPVNCTIFGVLGEYLTHAYKPSIMRRKNLRCAFDTPNFTD